MISLNVVSIVVFGCLRSSVVYCVWLSMSITSHCTFMICCSYIYFVLPTCIVFVDIAIWM